MFIPFLGAVDRRASRWAATRSPRRASASPARSSASLGAAALLPIGVATGNDFLRALAFTGFFLNLFNLLPVVPLDGGRAMAALAPWMWFVGFAALVALAFIAFPNPILLLILLLRRAGDLAALEGAQARGEASSEAYYRVTPRHRSLVAAVYIGLIVAARRRHGRHAHRAHARRRLTASAPARSAARAPSRA